MDAFMRKWDFLDHFGSFLHLCFLYTSDIAVGVHCHGALGETSVFSDTEIAIS